MSWYAAPVEVYFDQAESGLEQIEVTGQEGPHVDEAVQAAKDAAVDLIRSGVLGYGNVRVSLSGHANPGHKPTEGWSNDTITISAAAV